MLYFCSIFAVVYKLTGKNEKHLNSFVSECTNTEQLILLSNINNYWCSFHILLTCIGINDVDVKQTKQHSLLSKGTYVRVQMGNYRNNFQVTVMHLQIIYHYSL